VIVLGQLQIVTLTGHAHGDVADPGPGVEPGPPRPNRALLRGQRAPGKADSSTQELAALVEHGATGSRGPRAPALMGGPRAVGHRTLGFAEFPALQAPTPAE